MYEAKLEKPLGQKKNFLRSLIRVEVGTRLFVLEQVALLGGVTMGPQWTSLIKVLSARWHSSCSMGLLLLFFFAMNSFHLCQNLKKFKIPLNQNWSTIVCTSNQPWFLYWARRFFNLKKCTKTGTQGLGNWRSSNPCKFLYCCNQGCSF